MSQQDTLTMLTDLRRNLVQTLEMVERDRGLKNYPLMVRDFRENAGLLRDQVSGLQTAVMQSSRANREGNGSPSRKERLGLDKDQGSW
jgi:hypothetical protein